MTNTTTKDIPKDAIKTRFYAKGTWKLESVAHFGGDETGIADMCLLRAPDGSPFIPGASIAGAARSLLAQQCLKWSSYKEGIDKEEEVPELKRLFGGAGEDDSMSALIVADAVCKTDKPITTVRDGVGIDAKRGTARDKAKFDVEVVERGTEFKIELECIIRFSDAKIEKELKEFFSALLHAFEQGDVRLGARTRRGYGRGKVASWDTRELQMDNKQDVMAWLNDDIWENKRITIKPISLSTDERRFFRIEADFSLRTSLLIRSSSGDTDDPDMVHLHSKDKPVVPGTSFAGAFRHRAALIAKALNWTEHNNDDDIVCELFGALHDQEKKTDDTEQAPWASRVTIEERLVENVKPLWQDRVAIDRFTGGSLQSALFNQKPVYPCPIKAETQTNVQLRLTLEEPEKAEIGLLLLTLRDFWYGNATLGGEASNGRGTLRGIKAQLKFKYSDSSVPKAWRLSHDNNNKRMVIENDDNGFLQSCVTDAQNYSNCPSGSRRPKDKREEETDAE